MAERRYANWQQERLRGFEADEAKLKNWRESKITDVEKSGDSSKTKPSTSRLRNPDPLAKARFEWNKAVKEEYHEKFKKWSTLKAAAEKAGKSTGNFVLLSNNIVNSI